MNPVSHFTSASTGLDNNKFRHLRVKKQQYLGHIKYLTTCKKLHVIPKFIKVTCSLQSTYRMRTVLKRFHNAALRTLIKDSRSKLARIEHQLYTLHLKLSKQLPNILWQNLDNVSSECAEEAATDQRHRKKLSNLVSNNNEQIVPPTSPKYVQLMNNPKVVNISDHPLTQRATKTLELGLNFSKHANANNIDIGANVENAFKYSKLKPEQKDNIRNQICNVLLSNQKTHPNISTIESNELKKLQSNADLIICKADKGGNVVILNKTQYDQGLKTILSDKMYVKTERNPINGIMTNLKSLVKSSSFIDKTKRLALIPSYTHPGKLYILPKIHKPTLTFRPIISSIGTPTHALSKFLVGKLSYLSIFNPHSLKNSQEFITKLKLLTPNNMTMASFDVVSMFTNIPKQGALKALESHLNLANTTQPDKEAILKLVEFCINSTIFTCNQMTYIQKTGLPMGGPLSPLLCDIYMHYLETNIVKNSPITIATWLRYVDDTFTLMAGNAHDLDNFLIYINNLDPDVKFTMEIEQDNQLPFLDVTVEKTTNNFVTTVHRKPFSVQLPPHFRSAHPMSQKITAFYSLAKRALEFCSTPKRLNDEISFLKWVAKDRGFSPHIIDQAIRKFSNKKPPTNLIPDPPRELPMVIIPYYKSISTKIANILRNEFRIIFQPKNKICNNFGPPKDKPISTDRWGIYFIPCTCDKGYIGQTRRQLKKRIKEHEYNVKKADISKSNIAKHSWEENHIFKFNDARIIKSTPSIRNLDFCESFLITKFKNTLVNDHHFPFISHQWTEVIKMTNFKLEAPFSPI